MNWKENGTGAATDTEDDPAAVICIRYAHGRKVQMYSGIDLSEAKARFETRMAARDRMESLRDGWNASVSVSSFRQGEMHLELESTGFDGYGNYHEMHEMPNHE